MLLPFLYFNYNIYDILIVLSFLNIRGMMRHDIRFAFLIGNHHLLHHRHPKYNYGEYWLDYIFGTKYPNNADYQNGIIYL
jgi:hypothetical protein